MEIPLMICQKCRALLNEGEARFGLCSTCLDEVIGPPQNPIEENFWDDRTTPERDG